MAICPGGSQPKAGVPVWLVLVGTALELLITRRFPWLGPFLAFLSPFAVDTTQFCASEPPEMPEWTAGDLAGILLGTSSAKLSQTVNHVAWYEFCECSAIATPAPPVVNPPANVPELPISTTGTCDVVHVDRFFGPGEGSDQDFIASFGARRPLPPGATHIRTTIREIDQGDDPTAGVAVTIALYDAAGAVANPSAGAGYGASVGVHPPVTATGAINANAVDWYATCNCPGGNCIGKEITVDVEVFCGDPDRLDARCCPPDPTLAANVAVLLEMVTLIQRQAAPFAYVPAGEVAGLTGHSELAVEGLLAVSVLLTTFPDHYGIAEGEPDALFDAGWIAVGTADGWQEHRPIRHSPFMVRLTGDVTRVGLSLSPGVVATLRKHQREP